MRGCTLKSPGELFCLSVCFFNSAAWVLPPETPISLVCHAAWEAGFLKPFPCKKFHVLASWENRDGNDSSGNRRNNLQGSEPSVIRVFWLLRASAWPEAALFEKRLITQRLATSLSSQEWVKHASEETSTVPYFDTIDLPGPEGTAEAHALTFFFFWSQLSLLGRWPQFLLH